MTHPHVRLPNVERANGFLDRVLAFFAGPVLASKLLFVIALTLPLAVAFMSDSVKLILAVFSGSWIQWWALHALQRSQVAADIARDAKTQSDHEALTHIALTMDRIAERLGV